MPPWKRHFFHALHFKGQSYICKVIQIMTSLSFRLNLPSKQWRFSWIWAIASPSRWQYCFPFLKIHIWWSIQWGSSFRYISIVFYTFKWTKLRFVTSWEVSSRAQLPKTRSPTRQPRHINSSCQNFWLLHCTAPKPVVLRKSRVSSSSREPKSSWDYILTTV